jgi:hypothetical protein
MERFFPAANAGSCWFVPQGSWQKEGSVSDKGLNDGPLGRAG